VSEFRGLGITVIAGSIGSLAGAVAAVVFSVEIADTELMLGIRYNATAMVVLVVAGYLVGPWIALRVSGHRLEGPTAGLAAVWMTLLILSAGPIVKAIWPSWLPLAVAYGAFGVASLVLARTITAPFVRYMAPVPVPTDPAQQPVPEFAGSASS